MGPHKTNLFLCSETSNALFFFFYVFISNFNITGGFFRSDVTPACAEEQRSSSSSSRSSSEEEQEPATGVSDSEESEGDAYPIETHESAR